MTERQLLIFGIMLIVVGLILMLRGCDGMAERAIEQHDKNKVVCEERDMTYNYEHCVSRDGIIHDVDTLRKMRIIQ